jgi:hypothetical protein
MRPPLNFSVKPIELNTSNSDLPTRPPPKKNEESPVEIQLRWNTLIDSFLVEMLASIFVTLSVIFSWDWHGDNFALQFIPGIALGLIMVCIKDEDYFFPDASPFVTILIWSMGGYFSWLHSLVRLMAHATGFGIALWICASSPIPVLTYHRKYSNEVYFGLEAFTTALEHIAIVYVIMPLLPTVNNQGTRFLFPRVKPKSHPETQAPSNTTIMHAALIFSLIHWVFWRMLSCEMNPSVLATLSYLRVLQEEQCINLNPHYDLPSDYYIYGCAREKSRDHEPLDHWKYGIAGIWGQVVGLVVSLIYAFLFIPRTYKLKRPTSS